MKKNILIAIIVLFALSSLTSCNKDFVGKGAPNSPVSNFETIWKDFDQHYGAFQPKHVDWQAQYNKYRPGITEGMSDKALLDTLSHMLDALDDNHIYLRPTANTGLSWYVGGILGRTTVEDYRTDVAQEYLTHKTVYGKAFEYGFFEGNIGYINLKDFDEKISFYHKAMDEAMGKLKDAKGIIIELRENQGGEDRVAQYIANRFASARHLSFTSRLRNGPGHDDFAAPISFYTEPEGGIQYHAPVILLTDLNTFSSGETFVLAMLQNSNVRIVGDVTGGALSDAVKRELPNGWLYRMPFADVRDASGRNLENIGIQPHIKIQNTVAELNSGQDKALEKALEILR